MSFYCRSIVWVKENEICYVIVARNPNKTNEYDATEPFKKIYIMQFLFHHCALSVCQLSLQTFVQTYHIM